MKNDASFVNYYEKESQYMAVVDILICLGMIDPKACFSTKYKLNLTMATAFRVTLESKKLVLESC